MKIKLLFLIFLFAYSVLSAQKTVVTDEQAWFSFSNQTRISNKWGIWFDAHLRLRENFVGDLSQSIVRGGPIYYLNKELRLTAAYAYVHTFPAPGHAHIGLPEHRPWQQIQWLMPGTNVHLTQWLRLEERFRKNALNDHELDKGYQFSWRIRHNLVLSFPLTKKRFNPGGLQFFLNNELFVNFGKNIVYNYFDQNRFFVGFAYQMSKMAQWQAGYMNLYQQLPSGNQFRNQHTVRIAYTHNLDFRH